MASATADVVRRGMDLYNRGDFEALFAILADDVVAVVPDSMPNAGVYRGPEGFRRMLDHWQEAWDEFRIDIEELEQLDADGEVVLATVTQHARGRGSGIEASMPAVHMVRVRDGRLVEWRLGQTREEALTDNRLNP